jgi:hypothetical protein
MLIQRAKYPAKVNEILRCAQNDIHQLNRDRAIDCGAKIRVFKCFPACSKTFIIAVRSVQSILYTSQLVQHFLLR